MPQRQTRTTLNISYVEAAKKEKVFFRKMEDLISEQRRIKQEEKDKENWDKWNEEKNQD